MIWSVINFDNLIISSEGYIKAKFALISVWKIYVFSFPRSQNKLEQWHIFWQVLNNSIIL